MRNRLVFNTNSTEAWIEFESGAESCPWTTKEEALKDIQVCCAKKKISLEEAEFFSKKITESNLAQSEEKIRFESILEFLLDCLADETRMLVTAPEDVLDLPLKNPYFKICTCGDPMLHGYIVSKEVCIRKRIESKEEGNALVAILLKEQIITYADSLSLKQEISSIKNLTEKIDPASN